MRLLPIDLDRPRERHAFRTIGGALTGHWVSRVAVARPVELDHPGPDRGNDWNLLGQSSRHLTLVLTACAIGQRQCYARYIDSLDRADDPEFHDRPNHRIVGLAIRQ